MPASQVSQRRSQAQAHDGSAALFVIEPDEKEGTSSEPMISGLSLGTLFPSTLPKIGSCMSAERSTITDCGGSPRVSTVMAEETSEMPVEQVLRHAIRAALPESFRELGDKLRRDVREEIEKVLDQKQVSAVASMLSSPSPPADKERIAKQKKRLAKQKSATRSVGLKEEEDWADEAEEEKDLHQADMQSVEDPTDFTNSMGAIRFRKAAHRKAMEQGGPPTTSPPQQKGPRKSGGTAAQEGLRSEGINAARHSGVLRGVLGAVDKLGTGGSGEKEKEKAEDTNSKTRRSFGDFAAGLGSLSKSTPDISHEPSSGKDTTFSVLPNKEKKAQVAWDTPKPPERGSVAFPKDTQECKKSVVERQSVGFANMQVADSTDPDELLESIEAKNERSSGKGPSQVCFSQPQDQDHEDEEFWEKFNSESVIDEATKGPTCCDNMQHVALRIVATAAYDNISGMLVCLNAISIGVQTDHMARTEDDMPPRWLVSLESGFCLAFTLELILRMVAFRGDFFRKDVRWNLFDLTVVSLQVFEETVTMAATASNGDSSLTNFSFMRVLRILRLIRIVRVVRVLRLIRELRTIVMSIGSSLKSLFWTVVLLVLVIYVTALYITQVVLNYRKTAVDVDEVLVANFGSLWVSVHLLYQSISGGVDWGELVEPLIQHCGAWVGVLYSCYIAFITLAMLNVVTGVFVESVVENAKEDRDVYLMNLVRKLFSTTVADNSGMVSWQEFEQHLDNKYMGEFFQAIDVDISDAEAVFKLLDVDGTGVLDFDEFLNGCLRLRGPARALELAAMMHDTGKSQRKQYMLALQMQTQFRQMCDDNARLLGDFSAQLEKVAGGHPPEARSRQSLALPSATDGMAPRFSAVSFGPAG